MSTTFRTLTDVSKKQRMLFLADSMSDIFNPIAYATSANLSFSSDDVDVSNKMDGGWATSMQGKKSAEVSVDALCAYKEGLSGESELQTGWSEDKNYAFLYIMCTVEEQEDGGTQLKYDTSVPFYYGYMKLSSLELTSDNGDVAKFSVSGKSCGMVNIVPKNGYLVVLTTTTVEKVSFKALNPKNVLVGVTFTNNITSVNKVFTVGDDVWTWNTATKCYDKPTGKTYGPGTVGKLLVNSNQVFDVILSEVPTT